MMLFLQISKLYHETIRWLERALGAAVIIAILVFAAYSIQIMLELNWEHAETFYEMLNRILVLIIGIELVRMLVSHELKAVLELLAFVIARKMLHPELTSLDVLMGAVAFVLLMFAHKTLFNDKEIVGRGMFKMSSPSDQQREDPVT